jgi:16S rRNA (cytosine967-C5)-methyltransferase
MVEVQRLAAAVLRGVFAGRSLDAELAAAWQGHPQLDARRRAAVQDLAYGALRFLPRLEALLEALLERPLQDERLRALLLIALHQLEATRAAPHAVVDHAVRACHALGLTSAKGLANAVLRNFLRRRATLAARAQRTEPARYCHPQWWIDKLRLQYPEDYAAILEAGNTRPPLALRVNCRRAAVADYLALLREQGIQCEVLGEAAVLLRKALPAARVPGLSEGRVSVQDAGAQLAAPLLDLADGMRVLDACAAPGGKTGHALELADVDLTALDNDASRLERVRDNLARLGLTARVICGDACDPAAWWDGRRFDRILLDAPCSASGIVRRHPDIKWLRREADIEQYVELQRRMLDALWQTLESGGKFLYATCSVFREENREQVARFEKRHRDARRLALPALDEETQARAGQLLPDGRHDGFFYALLQKL